MSEHPNGVPSLQPAPPVPRPWNEGIARQNGSTGGAAGRPDPEVPEKPQRRKFTAEYKLRVLREADASPGGVGALLRREGLYSSHLSAWKRQREAGELGALAPRKRGRKGREKNPLEDRVIQLEREKKRLEKRLKRAEMILDVQKKISELLGIPLSPVPRDGSDF